MESYRKQIETEKENSGQYLLAIENIRLTTGHEQKMNHQNSDERRKQTSNCLRCRVSHLNEIKRTKRSTAAILLLSLGECSTVSFKLLKCAAHMNVISQIAHTNRPFLSSVEVSGSIACVVCQTTWHIHDAKISYEKRSVCRRRMWWDCQWRRYRLIKISVCVIDWWVQNVVFFSSHFSLSLLSVVGLWCATWITN